MNLNHWADGVLADGSMDAAAWGDGAEPQPESPPQAVRRGDGGGMHMQWQEMEKFAKLLRDDQDLMTMAPILAFVVEQHRTIQ